MLCFYYYNCLQENTNSLETQNSEYQINTRMLPKYMPESLAANILFIGRTISMFKSDPRQDKTNVWGDVEKNYYKKLASIQERNDFNISTLESTIIEIKTFVSQVKYLIYNCTTYIRIL